MKRKGLFALIIALIAVFSMSTVVGCSKPTPTLTLDRTEISIDVGAPDVTLVATVTNAADNKVTWTSSDSAVASVNSSGKVAAKSAGKATITATLAEDTTITATCEVTVSVVSVSGVTVEAANTTMTLGGDPQTLTATVAPANASNKIVDWSTNAPAVATVENGVVTAVGPGTVIITATSRSDTSKSGQVTLTVVRPTITGLTLSPSSVSVPLNKMQQFTAIAAPEYADSSVTWSIVSQTPETGYDSVIEATASHGLYKAIGFGTAKIKATSTVNNTINSEATITVTPEGTTSMIAISTPADFEQIYTNPADYYLTKDIDFGGKTLYGANSFMLVDMAVDAATGVYTAPAALADRFVNGSKDRVNHFIDRGTEKYDYAAGTPSEPQKNIRFFGPYDPASTDPLVKARYLILNSAGTAYIPIAQHDLFLDTSGNLETPGAGAGGILRAPYSDYKRIMTNLGNPLGTSGDTRVFHLLSTNNVKDVFNEGVRRYYQAPVVTFNGVFDGRGYSIKNFKMAIPKGSDRLSLGSAQWSTSGVTEAWGQSLFGNIGVKGIVRNVGFSNITLDLHGQGGLIASQNSGLIENIYISDIKSFTDSGSGDNNCGTGLLMGINNPTGRIRNIVFDGTGGTGGIGDGGNGPSSVYPIAIANRAGKTAASTQIQNIFIESTRFSQYHTTRLFINAEYQSNSPAVTLERGGYNPTAADNNAHLFKVGDIASVSFAALPGDIWDKSGTWPVLKKMSTEPAKVNYTNSQTDGSLGYIASGSPIVAKGQEYSFKINVLRTHQVTGNLTVVYSVAGGASAQSINGTASTPLSDGSIDYTFTVPADKATGDISFDSITGTSERSKSNVSILGTLPTGVSLTNADGVTVTAFPQAINGQSYTIGIYSKLEENTRANPSIKYSVGGAASTTLQGGYNAQVSGEYSYWFFTIPATDVTGAITFSDLTFEVKPLVPITFAPDAADLDGVGNWGTAWNPPPANVAKDGAEEFSFCMWYYMGGTPTAEQTWELTFTINGESFVLTPDDSMFVPDPAGGTGGEWYFVVPTDMIIEALAKDATKLEIVLTKVEVVSRA